MRAGAGVTDDVGMDTYISLAEQGFVMADLSTEGEDIRFWNTYALGMALHASVLEERGRASDKWRKGRIEDDRATVRTEGPRATARGPKGDPAPRGGAFLRWGRVVLRWVAELRSRASARYDRISWSVEEITVVGALVAALVVGVIAFAR